MSKIADGEALGRRQEAARAAQPPRTIAVCNTGCLAVGSQAVCEALAAEIERRGLQQLVRLKRTGRHGFCEQGPVVVIHPERIFYPRIRVEDVPEIVERTALHGEAIERLLYRNPATGEPLRRDLDVPFYKAQQRIVFRLNVDLDPTDLDDYFAHDGYSAAAKALIMSPEEIIAEITQAG